MSKIEVLTDRVEVEKGRIVIEMSVPMDFLREAVKNPDNIKQAFSLAFAEAMDDFITKRQLQQ